MSPNETGFALMPCHQFAGDPGSPCTVCDQAKELHARRIISIVASVDGWSEARMACGHSFLFLTDIGVGVPAPCAECIGLLLKRGRKVRL